MKAVAQELQAPLIDLHASSQAHIRSVGELVADRYAVSPPGTKGFDRTHLGPLGACIFAEQVLHQLPLVTDPRMQANAQMDCNAMATNATHEQKN